ncbi:MAG: pyridoxal phosphate-dependent aminotransferase [Acidobacteriota bacterium]
MRFSRRAGELRAAGHDLVNLTAGEPDFDSPRAVTEAARRALEEGKTRYTAAAGLPQLRTAIAEKYAARYGSPWQLPHTILTVGAKASLFQLFQVLVDEGDEVVLHTPTWVSFEEQIRFAGAEPVGVSTRVEDGFRIEAEPLIAAITDRTRAVLVNSPGNPTGGLVEAEDLRRIAEACAERDAILVCDETYDRFLYEGAEHASGGALAAEYPDHVVVISSFSKTYAMTGWRLGFTLGPQPLIAKMIDVQSHATSNPTTFAMFGGLAALENAEPDVRRMLEAFTGRRRIAVEALEALPGVECRPPMGAFYVFPRLEAAGGFGGSLPLAEHLLENAGLALVPGLAFGADEHLRLSFACSDDVLREGIGRLGDALAKL